MRIEKIHKVLLQELEYTLGTEQFEEYRNRETETQLDYLLSRQGIAYHSYGDFRDCDSVVITKNGSYQPDIDEETGTIFEKIQEEFYLQDIDENEYTVTLVSDWYE